jgi:hypothetical protein
MTSFGGLVEMSILFFVLVDCQFDICSQHLGKFKLPQINPFETMTEFTVDRENMPSPIS